MQTPRCSEGSIRSSGKIKVNNEHFALKETVLPVYPEEIEVIIACLREEAMNLIHPNIIERKSFRFIDNTFQLCMELGEPVYKADEGKNTARHHTSALLYALERVYSPRRKTREYREGW